MTVRRVTVILSSLSAEPTNRGTTRIKSPSKNQLLKAAVILLCLRGRQRGRQRLSRSVPIERSGFWSQRDRPSHFPVDASVGSPHDGKRSLKRRRLLESGAKE